MRKLLLFVFASAMFLGGLYLLVAQFLSGERLYLRFLLGSAILVIFGGYLLWVDFAAPLLGIKTWEDK